MVRVFKVGGGEATIGHEVMVGGTTGSRHRLNSRLVRPPSRILQTSAKRRKNRRRDKNNPYASFRCAREKLAECEHVFSDNVWLRQHIYLRCSAGYRVFAEISDDGRI